MQHLPGIPDDIDVCPNCGNVRYFSDGRGSYTLTGLIERLVEGGSSGDSVTAALAELREMFPNTIGASWHDFEIRSRVYFGGWEPFEIVHFAVDGCARQWRDYSWAGKTISECMAQVRQWKADQEQGEK